VGLATPARRNNWNNQRENFSNHQVQDVKYRWYVIYPEQNPSTRRTREPHKESDQTLTSENELVKIKEY